MYYNTFNTYSRAALSIWQSKPDAIHSATTPADYSLQPSHLAALGSGAAAKQDRP
jgi:hypothetical protein